MSSYLAFYAARTYQIEGDVATPDEVDKIASFELSKI
jgi:hypothetical protein